MAEEHKIKVDLDKSTAESQLKRLSKRAAQTTRRVATSQARRVSSSITGLSRVPSFGIGALTGYAAVGRILGRGRGGPIDPWEQLMVPLQASMQEFIDKKMSYSARTRMAAVNQTAQKMAINSHFLGETDSAKTYYQHVEPMMQLETRGVQIVRQDMKGPDFSDVLAQATKGYMQLVENAFSWWWDKLTG